ncbi:hypothetical protein Pyn_36103 [Prunus yedoensis var. nudiflora]|uniref:Uncharacterized protein n=1 Tax=Prunus yedoensis var. nudiflora TaxID=2094558 RepID=A0A314YCV3_PRUYE|nr:hypothetical protein Pyn_36103 [Prunus yedoensis var. nudiflora]
MSLEAVGRDGSEDGDDDGADVRVREVEIDENSEADGEAGGANEIKGELWQTAEAGEATISSTTNLAMKDMSQLSANCWRA